MKKNITAAAAALIAAAMLLTGCNNGGGTAANGTENQPDARAVEIAEEYFPKTLSDFTAWTDVDRSTIVASVKDGTPDKEFFDIPFSEFFNEYMYYLISYQIEDDMSDENKTTCEGYRDNIISYLIFERMYLYVADKDYGISEATLTDEQREEVRSGAETVKSDWAANFYTSVESKLGEEASEEEKDAMCDEVLQVILTRCGLDEDIFYKWELSRYIQELVLEALVKQAGDVTEEDVQKMFDEFIAEARDKAENDPAAYEELAVYSMTYIPEGTRTAKHIWLSYSQDDLTKIAQFEADGDIAGFNSAVQAAYTDEMKATVAEISEKLAGGADFAELQTEYGVSGSTDEMVVLKNSPSFFEQYRTALYSLENKGDVSEPIVCENGVYFIQYADDASVLEADVEAIKESMRSYLSDNSAQAVQNDAYTEWVKRFPYTIDYDTLKVNAENSVLADIIEK